MKTATDLAEAIEAAHRGDRTITTCPAHDDSTPSLSVAPGDEQPVILICHANCSTDDILAAAGLSWGDVSAEREKISDWTPNGRASDIYPYRMPDGTLSYEVLRVPTENGKRFFQRRPDGDGYKWNLEGVTRVLYRLPQVIEAVQSGNIIHIAEGEKCVHALLRVIADGEEATTNSGGAGRWREEYGHYLSGANVIVYADSDEVGREHARDIRSSLIEKGCSVKIVEAPPGRMENGKPISDIADHLAAGRGMELLLETTPDSEAVKVRTAVDWMDIVSRPDYEFEYIIPNVLARADRLLLVGLEGHGKSYYARQIGAAVASGIHPFTNERIEPKRVLIIDAENHPGQTLGDWKTLLRLCKAHGDPQPGMLNVLEEWDSVIDLISDKGKAWLRERVHAYRPDLLILGPLKNLVQRNLTDHDVVSSLRWTINEARSISQCAVIMEHHAPLRGNGDKKRELRPYGSGLFLGWPEFGYAMEPTETPGLYEWRGFRGDRVRGRGWPEAFRWGKPSSLEWPWMPTMLDQS